MQKLKISAGSSPENYQGSLRNLMSSQAFSGDVVQLGAGMDEGSIKGMKLKASRVSQVRFEPKALVRTAQIKECIHFTVPVSESERWSVNGIQLDNNSIFFNFGRDESEVVASRRNSLCGRITSKTFFHELGILGGTALQNQLTHTSVVKLPHRTHQALVQTLNWIISRNAHELSQVSLERHLIRTLAVAFALSEQQSQRLANKSERKTALVQEARDIFAADERRAVSVADMCAELHVSAPTLIAAFRCVVGETPGRFFTLQGLAHAHDSLPGRTKRKSSVKGIALSNGFNDLGRFGSYYKSIYGRLPSEV